MIPTVSAAMAQRYRLTSLVELRHGPQALRRRPPRLWRRVPRFRRQGSSCRTTSTGSAPASRRARCSPKPARAASSAWPSPSEYGGGGVDDFRFNQALDEQIAIGRHRRHRARHQPAQRHLPAVLPELLQRRAEAALAARHRVRRADHRGRDDRAGRRLRPGRHPHQRQARRRRVTSSTAARRSSPTASTPIW